MGFWIFMFSMNLLIPFTMLGIGWAFIKGACKEINGIVGYRTTMSMKNQETWDFAHQYCGKLWFRIGWIVLAVSVIAMLPLIGKSEDAVGWGGGIICMVQMVALLAPIFPTERALARTFDKDGKRK